MAVVITSPASASFADNFSTLTVTYTKIRIYADVMIRVNGTTVASAIGVTGTTVTFTNSTTIKNAIYAAAQGFSLTGCIEIVVTEYNEGYINVSTSVLSAGNLTLNARNTSFSLSSPTTASPVDLDQANPVNIAGSWARPHTAFRSKVIGAVFNGTDYTTVFTLTNQTATTINIDAVASYLTAFINAMNGVSPRNLRVRVYTQFQANTLIDLSGTPLEKIVTSGVIKTFVTPSLISIGNFELMPIDMSVPFSLTTYGSYPHTVRLYLKKPDGTAVLIKTQSISAGVTSGSFAIGSTERNIILNALPSVAYATTYAEVDTDTYGTTDSKSVATTLSLNADFKPTIGSVTWAEFMAYVKTALGYGAGTPFFLTSKSKLTFTVPVSNAVGATTASIRIQFAGTDKTQSTSPVTTEFLITSGSLQAVITVADSRGRTATLTTAAITVRQYTYPKIDKFEVYRSNSSGVMDTTQGTYLRCVIKGTSYSIKALDGTTEKNWIKYKIDYRVKNTGSFSNNAAVAPGALTFGELTTAALSGFLTSNVYDIRFRVFDAFYDLDGDASTLEDTDDYAEGLTYLPLAMVALVLGPNYASIGKMYGGVGTLDLGQDGNGVSLNTDGKILSGGIELIKRVDMVVTDFNTIDPSTLLQGRIYTFNTGFQAANRPTSENYHAGFLQVHNISGKNATLVCYSTGYGVYIRYWNGTSWSGWVRQWNDATDGSGSGLDSDLIDSFQLRGAANSIATDGIIGNGGSGLIGESVLLYKNTSTAVSVTTETQIIFNATEHNTNTSLFELASGVLTVKKAGVYMITGFARINAAAGNTSRFNVTIYKNPTATSPVSGGTQYILGSFAEIANQTTGGGGSIAIPLAANDTLVMAVYPVGAGVTVTSALTGNYMNVTKIA